MNHSPRIPLRLMSDPPPVGGREGQTQPGGILGWAEGDQPEEGEGGKERPMARAMILAGVDVAPSRAWRSPKRRKTSEMVTIIEMRIRTMMIQVWSGIFQISISGDEHAGVLGRDVREVRLSAIESDRISARSRNTRQRSLRTWMRGLISRYSRTAM